MIARPKRCSSREIIPEKISAKNIMEGKRSSEKKANDK